MAFEQTAAGGVLVAWGVHGTLLDRANTMLEQLAALGVPAWCLGTTKAGAPRHPLYVRAAAPLYRYVPPVERPRI